MALNGHRRYSCASANNLADESPMDYDYSVTKNYNAKSRMSIGFFGGGKSMMVGSQGIQGLAWNDLSSQYGLIPKQPDSSSYRLSSSLGQLCDLDDDEDMSPEQQQNDGDEYVDRRDPSRTYLTASRKKLNEMKTNKGNWKEKTKKFFTSQFHFHTLRKRDSTGLTKLDKPLDDWGEAVTNEFGDEGRRSFKACRTTR